MGFYLNSKRPYLLFAEEARAKYFVDKSDILAYLIPEAEPTKEAGAESISDERSHKYICITRPRRFGKTVMANMIAAYFGRDTDAGSLFGGLKAAGLKGYRRHLNQHNVIHIMFNEMPRRCTSYDEYIDEVNALGTALINLGLKDKRIAVISENRYEWGVAYFAAVTGTGIVVPLDKALPDN